MADLWYCVKCKTLYRERQERRCSCGGRVHRTSQDMEEAYQKAGYHYMETSSGLDFSEELDQLVDKVLEEEAIKEKEKMLSDFSSEMKQLTDNMMKQAKRKKKKFTLIPGVEPPNLRNIPAKESGEKFKKRVKPAAAQRKQETDAKNQEPAQKNQETSLESRRTARKNLEPVPRRETENRQVTEHKEKIDVEIQLAKMGLRKKRG